MPGEPRLLRDLSSWPDVSFWYGISPAEWHDLPRLVKDTYLEALPRLTGEYQLMLIQAAGFPQLKRGQASSLIQKLKRQATKRTFATKEAYAATVTAVGIGFEE